MQHMGLIWPSLAGRVERSGSWPVWVTAARVLASVAGLEELAAIVADRAHPGRTDELLAALVRLGAVDGGNDLDAAHAVSLLLATGFARLARQLRNLSGDIDQMVAGQVWLQIREFPWRWRRRASAANILMEARRALLRDLGVETRICARGCGDPGGHHHRWGGYRQRLAHLADHDGHAGPADELALVSVLEWATGNGVVTASDVAILLELANCEEAGSVRGLRSAAKINAVAARLGVNKKTVRRSPDRAVRALAGARQAYLRECVGRRR